MAFLTCPAVTFLGRKPKRGSFAPRAGALLTGGALVYGLSYDMASVRCQAGDKGRAQKDYKQIMKRWGRWRRDMQANELEKLSEQDLAAA